MVLERVLGFGSAAALRRAEPDDPDGDRAGDLRRTVRGLLVWQSVTAATIALYAIFGFRGLQALNVIATAFLLNAAALAVGGLLGFLFGVPRAEQRARTPEPQPAGQASPTEGNGDLGYRLNVNTNLEQISDWLTKIFVGVGLTEISNIPGWLGALARYFGPLLGTDSGRTPALALVVMVNGWVCGFFAGYLLTRLFLTPAFSAADKEALDLSRQQRRARELASGGDRRGAVQTLETASRQLSPTAPDETKRRLYEQMIYNALYVAPPEGFRTAINHATTYLAEEPATASGRIWLYLAAAYGQAFSWEQAHDNRPQELGSLRASALDAVRQTLRLDPGLKVVLRSLWDPHDPLKASEGENDLEPFFDDQEFKALLGETR